MYDIVAQIIDHSWMNGDSTQQYIMYVCACLIVLFMVTFIDLTREFIRGFIRR